MSQPKGRTSHEERVLRNSFLQDNQENIFPIGIKTPLEIGDKNIDTLFSMHYNLKSQIKDNLKNLILTRKGERLGFGDFGTNIHQLYAFEGTDEQIADIIMSEISGAVSKYMPAIQLKNFHSNVLKDEIDRQNVIDRENIQIDLVDKARSQKSLDFYENIEGVTLGGLSINKNKEDEVIYKIKLEYTIPIDASIQTLELYIRKAG